MIIRHNRLVLPLVISQAFPAMTSNDSPAPYKVTGSSQYPGSWWLPFSWNDNSQEAGTADYPSRPHWWQIDLAEPVLMHRARVWKESTGAFTQDMILYASNDNANFVELGRLPVSNVWAAIDITFEVPIKYRYWRAQTSAGNSWCHLKGFRLWKKEYVKS